jgi:ribonucleoside-diphosphate reductase alpha chain
MDSFATTVSVALQYGVPLRDLVNKFAHVRFEPSGFTGNQEIPIAKSIVDYIFRWLGSRFLSTDEKATLGLIDRSAITDASAVDAAPLVSAPADPTPAVAETTQPTNPQGEISGDSEAGAPPTASETPPSQSGSAPESASVSAPQGSAAEAAPREELAVIASSPTATTANGHAANGNGKATGNGGGGGGGAMTLSLGATKVSFQTQADAPSCAECGSIMVRNGSCYKCLNCGSTSGCS